MVNAEVAGPIELIALALEAIEKLIVLETADATTSGPNELVLLVAKSVETSVPTDAKRVVANGTAVLLPKLVSLWHVIRKLPLPTVPSCPPMDKM